MNAYTHTTHCSAFKSIPYLCAICHTWGEPMGPYCSVLASPSAGLNPCVTDLLQFQPSLNKGIPLNCFLKQAKWKIIIIPATSVKCCDCPQIKDSFTGNLAVGELQNILYGSITANQIKPSKKLKFCFQNCSSVRTGLSKCHIF